jgi:CheY-like chemotaxis protein
MSKSRKEAEDRSRDLLVVQTELERANQTKSNILAMTSHEVRTPLNGIMGMAQVLQRTAQSPEQIRLIETIMTSSEMLLVILNDILDMAGRLDIRADPVLVSGLIQGVEDLWRPKAEEKGLALEAQIDPSLQRARIVCDGGRVRQILSNLLSNAIKFSSTGAIHLRAETDDEILGRSAIVFSVKDHGIGIPAGHGKDLFEPFTQLESGATRKYGGTGLGLSICKKLVDLMDGQIGYESEPGEGTRFWFAIPLILDANQPVDAVEQAPQNALGSSQQSETGLFEGVAGQGGEKRILIAEDNPTNQIVIREMLRGQGYALDFAENGAIALEKLKAMPFDLVLMDVNMPVMNGVEAVAEIRRLEKLAGTPPLPVIAITADAFEEDRARLLANGMDDYISKPIDRLGMLDLLRAVFAAQGANEKGEVEPAIG